ncbi:zeta toxin family protein [Kribbella sp. NPDC055071]
MRTTAPELTLREADALISRRLSQITPPTPPVRLPGQRPLAVLIGGTPGSGKTTSQWLLQSSLGPDSTAVYDLDDDLAAHPRYDAIMRSWGLSGARLIADNLPPGMRRRCLDPLRNGDAQYDVIASAPLHREMLAKGWVDEFRTPNYRVALVYVVAHEASSALGRAVRLQQARDDTGIGRWVDPALAVSADRLYPDTAQLLESTAYVDDLYAVDRDGYVLYENHRGPDGLMPEPWRVKEAILAECNRPPTPAEHEQFLATAVPLLGRGDLPTVVREEVRTAMEKHNARPAPQLRSHALGRVDQRVLELQRLTGSGLAAPSAVAPTRPAPGASGRRSVDGGSREL